MGSGQDNRAEEFVPPKVTIKAFSGSGFRLGAPTSEPAAAAAAATANPAPVRQNLVIPAASAAPPAGPVSVSVALLFCMRFFLPPF